MLQWQSCTDTQKMDKEQHPHGDQDVVSPSNLSSLRGGKAPQNGRIRGISTTLRGCMCQRCHLCGQARCFFFVGIVVIVVAIFFVVELVHSD